MYQAYKILSKVFFGVLLASLIFSSCKKEDDDISNEIQLLSFGPSPALRGSELKIIGTNLDQVTSVVLSDNIAVSSFTSKTSELITLTIPEETVNGPIVLETPQGDISSNTILRISEPIVITSFSPEVIKPGQTLTINGDYLNLIKTVIFSSNVSIGDTLFVSQSREKIELLVPEQAQTGIIVLSNGLEMAIEVESETELIVTAPAATSIAPNPVKAGTTLTITGTDLDLVRQIGFEGTSPVSAFASQSETSIEVLVPDNAKDGEVLLIPGSFLEIPANEPLEMIVPQIATVTPNPVKNGEDIIVTGVDLDLVTKVIFGDGKLGFILNNSETEMTVKVPINATEDIVTFETAAEKTVSTTEVLELVVPTITGISPDLPSPGDEITIEGEDMDLIRSVKFSGDVEANTNNAFPDMATVNIPNGALSGPITVVTTNGTEVTTTFDLELALTTNAVITNIPDLVSIGEMISIEGTNLNELNELIFPEEVPATMFGTKTDVLIEVFVPEGTQTGLGAIKFITFSGEEFFSPEINIQGVDPVEDPDLLFFNFDGLDSWWGDVGEVENDPDISLDGSNYFRVNAMLSGWNGMFWRNGGDNFPGDVIGTNISGYVLKFDINIMEPMTGGSLAWRFKGSDGDFWFNYEPWQDTGSYMTNGWITVTVPLTEFYEGGVIQIPDMANIDSDFGVAFNNGDSQINIAIDNVRFEEQ